jgi:hypothetical protein
MMKHSRVKVRGKRRGRERDWGGVRETKKGIIRRKSRKNREEVR